MKTSYYLILIIFLLCTSCQEQYSAADIERQLLWNETIERSNLILKKNTSLEIATVKADIKTKTQYHPFYPKFKETTRLADSLYYAIEHLKKDLIEHSGNNNNKTTSSTAQTLATSIQSIYDNYLYLMEEPWKDGVKATMFADTSKKKLAMQKIKTKLDLPFLSPIRANPSHLEFLLKDKPLAAVLTLLSAIQNDIRKQEYYVFDFFARQTRSACNWGWSGFGLCALSRKFCIRLGETYEVDHLFAGSSNDTVRSVTIHGKPLPLENGRGLYAVLPTQVGEQVYRPTITFLNPYTNRLDSITKPFYFDVLY